MFGRMFGIAALALAGSAATAYADCDARARSVWQRGVVAEAQSQGGSCANAVATLVLRDASGKPIWVESFVGANVMVLAGAQNKREMTRALADWISQKNAMMPRTDKLPDWPRNAEAPQAGEFPFYPDSGIDREFYMKLRGQKLPMFCYVQGMESMACVALDGDTVTKVGVQTFPG